MKTLSRAAAHGLAAVLMLASTGASAVTPETIFSIVGKIAMTAPPEEDSTDFEKWAYATTAMSAAQCWLASYPGVPAPEALQSYPLRAGTYTAVYGENLEQLCTALATLPLKPWCSNAVVQGDSPSPDSSLMRDYLQMRRYSSAPQVSGGLYCHLTEYQGARQFFSPDKLVVTWAVAPTERTFTTASGERVLKAGTIVVSSSTSPGLSGQPFQQPFTAVVPQ